MGGRASARGARRGGMQGARTVSDAGEEHPGDGVLVADDGDEGVVQLEVLLGLGGREAAGWRGVADGRPSVSACTISHKTQLGFRCYSG